MARVLVVEDDAHVRQAVIQHLSGGAHAVRSVSAGLSALREINDHPPELVLLDLGLPDIDGSQVLQMIRAVSDVPILVTTARDDEGEIVRLLKAGADDYVVKPFSPEHLSARVLALLRRTAPAAESDELVIGDLCIDVRRRRASLNNEPLELTRREYDMLAYLAQREGEVVSRQDLLANVWQQSYLDDQTIDVHLSWLRRKLGERASEPRYLHTVRGVGVRLERPPPADA